MSKAKNFTIQAPNATAVNVLRTWLRTVGVPVRASVVEGFDLTVVRADGSDLEVQVTKRLDPLVGQGLQVSASAITGKRFQAALAAFYSVTDAAGYDRVQPVDRGAEPALNTKGNPRKLHYKDEDFLVAIRHTEFRRSINPSDDRWTKYKAVMEKTSASFMRQNFELCARHGLTIDDVMQYARCYVVNFCTRYEIPEDQTTFCDNERKCYAYLRQQFCTAPTSSLRAILLKKQRSTMPDTETVGICLFGKPDADTEVSPDAEDETDYDYIGRHCELDKTSTTARRKSAASKLASLLDALPHDQLVELLRGAADNASFDVTTRREAMRQLRLHLGKCESCATAGDAGVEEDKDLSGTDALGTAE
jgi:hypothetical protein